MELFNVIIFFILGTVFGSFYNVVGLRVPRKIFLQSERSICPKCEKTLNWYELIPIYSYILQKGKCRGCQHSISIIYPLIELLTGVSFVLCYWHFGLTIDLIFALVITSLAVIVIVTDLSTYLIPNRILLFFLPWFILFRLIIPVDPWWSPIAGAVIGFSLILVIIVASKGGMGAGDMKYFGVLGIAFGYQGILLVFLIATFFGALINLILLVLGKVTRKSKIPFGPYISLATLTVLFWGEALITWYIELFF